MKLKMPEKNDLYRHHKSGLSHIYRINDLGISTETGRVIVLYSREPVNPGTINPDDVIIFSRDLSEFLGYTEDHTKRFEFIRKGD